MAVGSERGNRPVSVDAVSEYDYRQQIDKEQRMLFSSVRCEFETLQRATNNIHSVNVLV